MFNQAFWTVMILALLRMYATTAIATAMQATVMATQRFGLGRIPPAELEAKT